VRLGLALALIASAASAVAPHRSFHQLTTATATASPSLRRARGQGQLLLRASVRAPSPGTSTRNLAFDAYFGLRAAGEGAWLSGRAAVASYVEETHVIRAVQDLGRCGPRARLRALGPAVAGAGAGVARRERVARAGARCRAYGLLNFHLGSGSPSPAADRERIDWDAATRASPRPGRRVTLRYVCLRRRARPRRRSVCAGRRAAFPPAIPAAWFDDAVA